MRSGRRLLLASLVGLPLLGAAIIAIEVAITLDRDYLREPEFDVEFTVPGCRPTVRMAVLGDSTVAGVGATSERDSLPGQVARKVAVKTGRSVAVTGFGVSGARTRDVLREQLPQIERGAFDVIVIEVGSNDVTHGTRLGALERDTREMLEMALSRADVVVLGSSGRLNSPNFPQPLRQIVMARATSVRARQADVARDLGVPIVDIAREVSPIYDRTPGANSRDLFHPSDVGYEIWARPLARRVVEQLGESNPRPPCA